MKVAVIGGGWAGLACAVEATRAGHAVTLREGARRWGGRARALDATLPDGSELLLDNGQHILIGAYEQTLRLMAEVGVDAGVALQRIPLALRFPDGGGLTLPALPDWLDRASRRLLPLDVLAGVLSARGWSWRDKQSLLRTSGRWQAQRFRCPDAETVQGLCAGLTPRVQAELTEPLCLSALNTPPERASGQVFLRVLEDALFKVPGGSQLLLPRVDLGALFPDPAADWLRQRGARCELGRRVQEITREGAGWRLGGDGDGDGESFDRVVLACPPGEAARLTAAIAPDWAASAQALRHEAIATVYAWADGARLALPLLALRSTAEAPAQFVFDRGQLGGPRGLLAFVVSASVGERESLQRQVLAQAQAQLALPALQPVTTVVEKRATFACTPGLSRPVAQLASGLWACGDYVDGPYPATLEGAVRSAIAVAAELQDPAP